MDLNHLAPATAIDGYASPSRTDGHRKVIDLRHAEMYACFLCLHRTILCLGVEVAYRWSDCVNTVDGLDESASETTIHVHPLF